MSFDLNKDFVKRFHISWLKMTENCGHFFQMLTQQTLSHKTQLEGQKRGN